MHIVNNILSTLDIDSSQFRYNKFIPLYDDNSNYYGKVTFCDGRYRLTVGPELFNIDDLKN